MLASTIQKELALMILRDLNDPRLSADMLPTITRVKVSPDLSIADVYVTIMGTPGKQTAGLNALKHSAGLMRTKLTKSLTLRVAPYIKFHMDEELKKELDLLNVLQKVHDENEELDRRRAESGESGAAADDTTDNDQTTEAKGAEAKGEEKSE
jgi:ribosome-binding factor A